MKKIKIHLSLTIILLFNYSVQAQESVNGSGGEATGTGGTASYSVGQVFEMVKAMVDAGQAIALMGNHEFNAVCYHTLNKSRLGYLRPHTEKNIDQHKATIDSIVYYARHTKKEPTELLNNMISWFKELPYCYEDESIRAIHACWGFEEMLTFRQKTNGNTIPETLWEACSTKKNACYDAIEILLKGREINLPDGKSFLDKDGHPRTAFRACWWKNIEGLTIGEAAVKPEDFKDASIKSMLPEENQNFKPYGPNEKPVFFGHYWLNAKNQQPQIQSSNTCCLDFSVAKNGILVAYRYSGEKTLSNKNFVVQANIY